MRYSVPSTVLHIGHLVIQDFTRVVNTAPAVGSGVRMYIFAADSSSGSASPFDFLERSKVVKLVLLKIAIHIQMRVHI